MSSITSKPPLYGGSPSPTPRRRKVNRQSAVPKQRHRSPGKLQRSQTYDASSYYKYEELPVLSSDEDNADDIKKVETKRKSHEKMTRPSSLTVETFDVEENNISYKSRRRNTERVTSFSKTFNSTRCECRPHINGSCGSVRRRHTLSPVISKQEVMEKETKLIVLEYLSSLSPEQLTARYESIPVTAESDSLSLIQTEGEDEVKPNVPAASEEQSAALDSDMKIERKGSKKGFKSNTVTIGENERKLLLQQIKEHEAMQNKKMGRRLVRSSSDVTKEHYAQMKKKLEDMQVPIRKWIDENLKQEIARFDKSNLNTSPIRRVSPSPRKSLIRSPVKLKKEPLSLTMPRRSMQMQQHLESTIFTPDTFAVDRLEAISQDIMENYPELLKEAIDDILKPLHKKSLTYDLFSKVANTVFSMKLSRVSETTWSRVALVLYMVKETMFLGNLNDTQLEVLVEHSAKFMSDNVNETVERQGGWDAIEVEDLIYTSTCLVHEEISSEEDTEIKSRKISRHHFNNNNNSGSVKEIVRQTVSDWTPYGMAALAVGLGLAYSYLKT